MGRATFAVVALILFAGCEVSTDGGNQITDRGLDGGTLQDGLANIWVSPDGCQYWYIDDGIEGFMAPRLNRDGTPICSVRSDRQSTLTTKEGTIIEIEQEPEL